MLTPAQYHADRGEIDFSYRLGKIFYHGSVYAAQGGAASGAEGVGWIGRDYHRARVYFVSITRLVWPTNNIKFPLANKKETEERVGVTAAMAAGYLGRMYLRGEGVKKDAKVAKMWFERGAEYGDRESQNGLALIYRDGLIDGKMDLVRAIAFFTAAAGQDLAEAQVQLGKHHYGTYRSLTPSLRQVQRLTLLVFFLRQRWASTRALRCSSRVLSATALRLKPTTTLPRSKPTKHTIRRLLSPSVRGPVASPSRSTSLLPSAAFGRTT